MGWGRNLTLGLGVGGRPRTSADGRPRVLIIVENLPLARDLRVQRECQALVDCGYGVSVICPGDRGGDGQTGRVRVHHYPPPPQGDSVPGYAFEFVYSGVAAAILTLKALVLDGIDVLQACNPPDTSFLLALPLKLLGKPFVFDHHDLAPELYAERFGREGVIYQALRLLERATFLTADHVISTNESFRRIALSRGRKRAEAVTVVRNGPVLEEVRPRPPRPELKEGRPFLCCWAGVMGSVDDGLDLALQAVDHVVHRLDRKDCHFALLGDGEALEDLRTLARNLDVVDFVTFTGWLDRDEVYAYLSTADVAMQPDPKNRRTDASTATKTMEYMAFGLPTVAFDVDETRFSAGGAALYADRNDPAALAALIVRLLDDAALRQEMGEIGRKRVEEQLAWDHQQDAYVAVFDRLVPRATGRSRSQRQ